MDNCAYFFTGVLAGVAGLTLLAVLDHKYGIITGSPVAPIKDTNKNLVIIYRGKASKPDEKSDASNTENQAVNEQPEAEPKNTESQNPIVPPVVAVA